MKLLKLTLLKVRDILGLPSMQEIFPGVYAGDFGDVYRVKALKKAAIAFVLNVAEEIDDPDLSGEGIRQAKCGLVDWDCPANEARVRQAMDLLDRQLLAAAWPLCILVHCEGGRNRTLYVLARWWAVRTGRDWKSVAAEIQQKRPEMALHAWMLKQGPKYADKAN